MELTVLDRLALLGLLPNEGDVTTLLIVRQLRESLTFTEEEHEALGFKYNDEKQLVWNAQPPQSREYDFPRKQREAIEEALNKADKAKKLTLDSLPVYEKFFPPEEPELKVVGS